MRRKKKNETKNRTRAGIAEAKTEMTQTLVAIRRFDLDVELLNVGLDVLGCFGHCARREWKRATRTRMKQDGCREIQQLFRQWKKV